MKNLKIALAVLVGALAAGCYNDFDTPAPEKLYTDEETGHVYSGALLMHGGLDLSANDFSSHDGEALVKHFVAKA